MRNEVAAEDSLRDQGALKRNGEHWVNTYNNGLARLLTVSGLLISRLVRRHEHHLRRLARL